MIVPEEETSLQSVIIRGQFRLADQQVVRIVNLEELSPGFMSDTLKTSTKVKVKVAIERNDAIPLPFREGLGEGF